MRPISIIILVLFIISCAKVSVETSKPIKVDINMRVDIYQHVVKDVEDINDQIYGTEDKDFNALFGFNQAYAEDSSDLMASAISRRKARLSIIEGYFAQGYIGENKDALLELRSAPQDGREQIESFISQENSDRNIIYQAVAEKNQTDISTVRKASLESDYKRAAFGYWFQVPDSEGYTWKRK